MEPAEMKKYVVPGVAVAALIAVAGLLLGLAGPPPDPKPAKPKPGEASTEPVVKAGADTSDEGMGTTPPPAQGPEWRVLANGLKIWDVKEGTGDTVSAGQTVSCHYIGWRANDGFVFDTSRKQGKPIEFSLNGVVQGWSDGIPGMKVGGVRRLYVPSALGYGAQGMGAGIPPNTDLIFEVKLIGYR
jgi:FKBP-type peptidyl-prolyl cis-trans isomerase